LRLAAWLGIPVVLALTIIVLASALFAAAGLVIGNGFMRFYMEVLLILVAVIAAVLALPLTAVLHLIFMTRHSERAAVHDVISHTRVVMRPRNVAAAAAAAAAAQASNGADVTSAPN
jgi:hypothetical protein